MGYVESGEKPIEPLPKRQWCVELRREGEDSWMPIVWKDEFGVQGGLYDTEAEAQKYADQLKWAATVPTNEFSKKVYARAALWGE